MTKAAILVLADTDSHADHDVTGTGVKLLDEFEGHPSIRSLVYQGYTVLTF